MHAHLAENLYIDLPQARLIDRKKGNRGKVERRKAEIRKGFKGHVTLPAAQ